MTRVGDIFEPEPDDESTSTTTVSRVYQQMYRRLKPLYEGIRDITGYPLMGG